MRARSARSSVSGTLASYLSPLYGFSFTLPASGEMYPIGSPGFHCVTFSFANSAGVNAQQTANSRALQFAAIFRDVLRLLFKSIIDLFLRADGCSTRFQCSASRLAALGSRFWR